MNFSCFFMDFFLSLFVYMLRCGYKLGKVRWASELKIQQPIYLLLSDLWVLLLNRENVIHKHGARFHCLIYNMGRRKFPPIFMLCFIPMHASQVRYCLPAVNRPLYFHEILRYAFFYVYFKIMLSVKVNGSHHTSSPVRADTFITYL